MTDKWEIVAPKKQKSGKGESKSKDNTFQTAVNEPNIEKESFFAALAPKEKNKTDSAGTASKKATSSTSTNPKSAIPRPNKNTSHNIKKSGQKPKLESSIKELTAKQFEDKYAKSQESFRDNALIWLKELTALLNLQLVEVPMGDPLFADKSKDYPSSLLDSGIAKVFQKCISECSSEQLQIYLEGLLQTTQRDLSSGTSVYGYQIATQLLAKCRPDIFLANLPKHLEMVVTTKNHVTVCHALLWMVGQGGLVRCHEDQVFRVGLKIWSQLMLQLLGIKALAAYSVSYIGTLLQNAGIVGTKVDRGYGVIEMKDYFLLLDGVFAKDKSLPGPVQKQLKQYYPNLKELAFAKSQKLAKFFPSFLHRIELASTNVELQNEVLQNAVSCLNQDGTCYADWEKLYPKHLDESSVLLNYIADGVQSGAININLKAIQEAVKNFKAYNEKTSKTSPSLERCRAACQRFDDKRLVKKVEYDNSTARSVILFCLIGLAVAVAIDSYISGSFEGSRTRMLLRDTGADALALKIYADLKRWVNIAYIYLAKHVPVWTEAVVVYLEPFFQACWKYSVMATTFIVDVTKPAWQWVSAHVPVYLDWVIMHPIWTDIYNLALKSWAHIEPYISPALDCVYRQFNQTRLYIAQWMA